MELQNHQFILFTAFTVTIFLTFIIPTIANPDKFSTLPNFAFSWLDGKDTFEAGDIATIKIKVLGNFDNQSNLHTPNLTLTVNEKQGNSSYISGVSTLLHGDPNNWSISFIPILAGLFNLLIDDPLFGIADSSLHFQVSPGRFYPSVGVASWRGLVNEFVAGTKASVLILPKDAFGNNVSSKSLEPSSYKFIISAFHENGTTLSLLNVTYMGWNQFGYVGIEFVASTTGNFSLHIEGGNQSLNGSPLPFKVEPGLLDISNCLAKWNYDTNALQIFSKLEIFIHQQDKFGNLVPDFYDFDAQVVENGTKLAIPIPDLQFKEVAPGIQLFSFIVLEPGEFMLTIFNMEHNQTISNMPYQFTVFVGYCDGGKGVVNGSGLTNSIAGKMSSFSVYLEDMYHNPSPVEAKRLRVQITRKLDLYNVLPTIHPMPIFNGQAPTAKRFYGGSGSMKSGSKNSTQSGANLNDQVSAFDVHYTPERAGDYEIRVFCGNIPLNGGHPFAMKVRPGEVDLELSRVVRFVSKVQKLLTNEIVVQLVDSLSNPVELQQTKLSLEFRSVNGTGFLFWTFEGKMNGTYIAHYLAKDIGAYDICISFEDKHLNPCPFSVFFYSNEYFPKAYDDTISVWEDESISFDVLGNDYFAGGNANIVDSTMPRHGSLLRYDRLFRYTPYKGFFGNDSFSYTISDINNNNVTGTAIISVFITPPEFVSLPVQLQATEDLISPRFGGFEGFEIKYSDSVENISVILVAEFGTLFLSPMLMQFWQPSWDGLVVDRDKSEDKGLMLIGCVRVINSALQSIQYLGNGNFSGDDFIKASMKNKNGVHDTRIPIFVEPINDAPYINVPKFIMLERGEEYSSRVFDERKDKFEFSIQDPDLLNFPGNESHFKVTLSMEVNAGILITTLPAELISTTELKLKNSYRWQPLQTFVTISKHFTIRGKGVRFRGTINDCTDAMQQLLYQANTAELHVSIQGKEHGAVLTVTVNDMGNYGCYPDCAEKMSLPLFTKATVNLIRRKPMSSVTTHTLGSVIVIEFITMLILGCFLLFFICKCALLLSNGRKKISTRDSKLDSVENSRKPSLTLSSSEKRTYLTECCSNPSWLKSKFSNFRQRSRREFEKGKSIKDDYNVPQFSNDHCQFTPLTNFTPLSIEKGEKNTV